MNIVFSRHAKRRCKLYDIPEEMIIEIINKEGELTEGRHEIIKKAGSFFNPLKVIIEVQSEKITVITSYPLKKGRQS